MPNRYNPDGATGAEDMEFLKQRGHSWYVRVAVPKHLQAKLGRKEFVQALNTRSKRAAMSLRWPVVAEIQKKFVDDELPSDPAKALELAKRIQEARQQPLSDDEPEGFSDAEMYAGLVQEQAYSIEREEGREAAKNWFEMATKGALPLSAAVDQWLSETAKYTQQSRNQHRDAVRDLQGFLGDAPLTRVDRAAAGRFVSDRLLKSGAALKTVNRKISSLSSLWAWAIRRGHVEANPWSQQGVSKAEARAQAKDKRPYTAAELRTLLFPGPEDEALRDLMMLAVFLGARINEMCELKPSDIENGGVHIRKGKTAAAERWLPIPLGIRSIVRRRAENDEWLFPEATPGGPDKKRSWNIGKRVRRFIHNALPEAEGVDFHSFRRTYSTACERAELYQPTHDELMGHKKATLALSLYSGGQSRDQLRKAQRDVSRKIVGWLRDRGDD